MNDRIRELMTKCNYVVDGTCDTSREEKLAQMIVEECAKRAEVYAYMSPNFNALAEELRSMIGVAQ